MKKYRFISMVLSFVLGVSFFTVPSRAISDKVSTDQDTDLVFVVDKSGSMYGLAEDTIGSFNSVIDEQKQSDKNGEVYVTTVMFNTLIDKIHDHKDIKTIEHITKKDYSPSGCTSLLDAVGNTIVELSAKKEAEKNKVLFVVITDGYENSSKEFKKDQVKKLIDEKKKSGWKFIFLGANIDSFSESGKLGIDKCCTRNFVASADGVKEAFRRVTAVVNQVRDGRNIDLDEDNEDLDSY